MSSHKQQNNAFMNGLENAQHLLSELDRSIKKTTAYEKRLFRFTELSSRGINLGESWSTMSIVCLQYQYEELSKRYECLLETYNDRCKVIKERDSSLYRMRELTAATQSEVTLTHEALLTVGQKYFDLKDKHDSDKRNYEDQIANLKKTIYKVSRMAKKARRDLDVELTKYLATERETSRAALLAEVKRCNKLIIENIKLKQRLQGYMNLPENKKEDEN